MAARLKMKVWKESGGVTLSLQTADEEVGYLFLAELGNHSLRNCEENVDALRAKVFGDKSVKLLRVQDVRVDDEYLRQGWGIKMYERALKAARPAILITGGCTGMGTTMAAWRVWKSLSRKYETMGDSPDDFVLAVK